jgi:hypothetical protein
MTDQEALERFAEDLFQDLFVRANTTGGEQYLEEAYTGWMLEMLSEAGEVDECEVAFHQSRGIKVNAYGISDAGDVLYLFTSMFVNELPPRSLGKLEVNAAFGRLRAFLTKAARGDLHRLEESSPGFEMIDFISARLPDITRARLYLLTDALTSIYAMAESTVDDLAVSYHIWDLRRTFQCVMSGQQHEPVEIDFAAMPGGPVPCLAMPGSSDEYSAYLMILTGSALYSIYEQYGTRLLERNVRAFLQVRGKINRAIRETILKSPDRFLAYNNGISATAASVTLVDRQSQGQAIASVRDFQIVNGGQTIASIYHAVRKDKADASAISVQAKLSVVEPGKLDSLVPLISRFANSQNKVGDADFSANDPFHVAVERLSRTVWTTARPGEQRQTRWFYERARGQYADAQFRAGGPAEQKQFKLQHPVQQRFTKTDLAKYENSWLQLPHFVARGAEKSFREFTLRLPDRGGAALASEAYFRHLVAKAILFRETERIVAALQFGGYRSQIVTYTIAYLSHVAGAHIELDAIWREQALPDALREILGSLAPVVHRSLTHPPGGQNIAEWCKKQACWDTVQSLQVFPQAMLQRLKVRSRTSGKEAASR